MILVTIERVICDMCLIELDTLPNLSLSLSLHLGGCDFLTQACYE